MRFSNGSFEGCTSAGWRRLGGVALTDGSSAAAAAQSCLALLTAQPGTASGITWIDPDGSGGKQPVPTYCDMTTDGGGWSLVGYSFTASVDTNDNNKNMPSLRCGGGQWSPRNRVGAGAIDATDLASLSTEIAFSMTITGSPVSTGGVNAYALGYKFALPVPAKVHFKNFSILGPNNNLTDGGSGPCVPVTVIGIQGTMFTGTRYTLQNALGASWSDSNPSGYGAVSSVTCQSPFSGGPFIPSVHTGHGGTKTGVLVSECDVAGSTTYAFQGTFTDSTVNNTGANAIWLR